jgi:hypothetical protein
VPPPGHDVQPTADRRLLTADCRRPTASTAVDAVAESQSGDADATVVALRVNVEVEVYVGLLALRRRGGLHLGDGDHRPNNILRTSSDHCILKWFKRITHGSGHLFRDQ